ncbi:MAG: hypothetical protein B0W54_06950 [Cellvibrio sp. 79]|nr:MAG: hypothetical protein B0W54_06950 [Cellvibrio sp. 79]
MKPDIKQLTFSLLTIFFVGCGGGGGGGGGGNTQSSTVTAESSSSQSNQHFGTIVFSEKDDSFVAIPASLIIAESIQQLTQVPISSIVKFINDGQPTQRYNHNDTVKILFNDNDLNLQISSGDELLIEYLGQDDIYINNIINDVITGKMRITIKNYSTSNNDLEFSGSIDYIAPLTIGAKSLDSTTIEGSNLFNYKLKKNDSGYAEVLVSESISGQKFTIKNGATSETISDFKITKNVTPINASQSSTDVSFSLFYEQGSINNSFTCSADSYSTSANNTSHVVCKGKNSNAIRWKNNTSPVEIDATGNGSFKTTSIGLEDQNSYMEGFLFGDYSNRFPSNESTLPVKNLFITHDKIAPLKKQASLIIASNNTNGEPSLYLYNESTQQRTLIKSVRKKVDILHMSEDESVLYVAYKDDSTIDKYETSNFTLIQQINVGTGLEVLDIDTTIVKPDLIAVVTKPLEETDSIDYFESDVKVFQNGIALPATYGNFPHPALKRQTVDSATFSTQGDKLFCGIRRSDGAVTLTIDTTGITQVINHSNSTIRGKVKRHNKILYANGNYISEDKYLRIGSHYIQPPMVFLDNQNFIIDARLNVYNQSTHATIAQNDLKLPDNTKVHNLIALNDHVYLSTGNLIKEIKIDDFNKHLSPTSCGPASEKNKDGIEITSLSCGVTDIAHSTDYPNIILAGLGENAGIKSKSLLLINKDAFDVQEYIPLPATPKSIYVAGNQQIIYIVFDQSSYVGRLDLSQQNRKITLIPFPTAALFQSVDDISISVALHDDLFVGALANNSSKPKERLNIFKNGERLPYTMVWTQFAPDNTASNYLDYQFRFAEDEKLYTVLDAGINTIIRKFSIADSAAVQDFSLTVQDGDLDSRPMSISGDELFFLDGTVVNLSNSSIEKRIKKPNIDISMYAHLPSDDKSRLYQLGQHYSVQGGTLYTFNSTTGEFLTSFNLRPYYNSADLTNSKLLELSDELLVKEGSGTLFKVPKHHLQ